MVTSAPCPARSVRIVHLDMLVQYVPFTPPAVDCAAVDTATVGDYLQGQLLDDEQLHSESSRFRQVRVGRIGHGRLLSVRGLHFTV